MLKLLKKESNYTQTENGALALRTTGNYCLDLFSSIGASRYFEDKACLQTFYKAYYEDKLTALKILFYSRDIRGGLGERSVFRKIVLDLAFRDKEAIITNLDNFAYYGRYDDLLSLLTTPCHQEVVNFLHVNLLKDMALLEKEKITDLSLLAKWMPSINASNQQTRVYAKMLIKGFGWSAQQYRLTLSRLRKALKIIENNLRLKDYQFDYELQTSRSLFKYREAFIRNDNQRYTDYLDAVNKGNAKMNTGTLFPYDIVNQCLVQKEMDITQRAVMETTWRELPGQNNRENTLVVVDGSGSMYMKLKPSPIAVALSLGIFFAQRNEGMFKNHFITFSRSPQLIRIKGKDIYEQVNYCQQFDEVANTDVQAVFDLILRTAKKHKLPQKDLPKTILIISDMEFDNCTDNKSMTNFELIKKVFNKQGYRLPHLVFWNVANRSNTKLVTQNETGVTLISGQSPIAYHVAFEGESAQQYMMRILNQSRYNRVKEGN